LSINCFDPLSARNECMKVIGTLLCPSNPTLANNVRIDLKDEDCKLLSTFNNISNFVAENYKTFSLAALPFEVDDIMGRTWSQGNGSFVLSGCGADMGPFNKPDPYVYIEHKCPSTVYPYIVNATRKMQFALVPTFLPMVLRIGKVYLDDSDV
uniref:Transthyretin-like protein 52 (inferred by orthology to a C. elegans protein) n=1 Tax=Anisakis simplex TaxID=6269 RepID=A0A0M3KD26_ANISI